jgi:Cu-Zn family superoxide dismutase
MKASTISAGAFSAVFCLVSATSLAAANELTVEMNKVSADGVGEKIGTIVIQPAETGLSFKVDVKGIAPGEHGFHLHTKGDCASAEKDGKAVAALAAGGHYDPADTKTHAGPAGHGHKGDLPFLTATNQGINAVVNAPELTMADVSGRALVIHDGGDNYTDHPANGGGKGRIACGVVPEG